MEHYKANSRNVEEIVISPEKRQEIFKQIKTSIIKWNTNKISKLLNDSTASKFVTIKWMEVNNLPGGQYSVKKNEGLKLSC